MGFRILGPARFGSFGGGAGWPRLLGEVWKRVSLRTRVMQRESEKGASAHVAVGEYFEETSCRCDG